MIFSLILDRQTFFSRLHKAELSNVRRSWGYKVQGLGRVDGVSWCCSIGINVKMKKNHSQTFIPQLPNGRVCCWHNPHAGRHPVDRSTSTQGTQVQPRSKRPRRLRPKRCFAWPGEVRSRWIRWIRWINLKIVGLSAGFPSVSDQKHYSNLKEIAAIQVFSYQFHRSFPIRSTSTWDDSFYGMK